MSGADWILSEIRGAVDSCLNFDMEPPPSGQSGGLHPQDRAPCSLTTVFDLTRKGEESLLKTNSMDTIHVVKGPSWYNVNPVTNKGPLFPENASDHTPLPSEQIQPDDAFSNTTVTLSYVNRSHVFSSHDSLSQLHPLCGVSSISRKLSRHSSSFETDTMLTEAGRGGLCVEVGQGFLSHAARPVGLAAESSLFETEEQAQIIESVTGQQAIEVNGKQAASTWGMDNIKLAHGDSPEKCLSSQEKDKGGCMQNGMGSGPWNLESHEEKCSESLITGTEGAQKKCDSEVLLLISRTDDPIFLQDHRGPRNFLCSSLNGDYVSPLDDPLSPSTTSVDDMEDVFILPQTLNSPSGENSFTDEAANITEENLVEGEPCSDLSVTPSTLTAVVGASSLQSTCSHEDVIEMSISRNGIHAVLSAVPEPYVESPEMGDSVPNGKERIPVQKKLRTPDLLNGNAQEDGRRFERKKLPPRSRRGMRLEAIVQNITPSRHKVTSSAHSTKKHCSPKTQTNEMHSASIGQGIFNSAGSHNYKEKEDCPEEQPTVKSASLQEDTGNIYLDHSNSKKSTSGSEHASISKPQHCSTSPKPCKPPYSDVRETENGQSCASPAKCSPRQARSRALPVPKVCQKSPTKQLSASTSSKATHSTKKTHKAKRKRKKCKAGQSSMFSPKEPEIKLKYVNYKEEKRDKLEAFSPFVHMEVKEYSTCTVINYPEEESARLKKGQQQVCSSFISGAVPSTSCLQLGRLSTESKRQSSLVCSLCGKSANSLDLGDLHGPYYPENFKPALKAHLGLQGLKGEEDDSDSDSSCSAAGSKRSRAAGSWPQRPCHRLKQEAVLGACSKWDSDSDASQSPLAKKPRTESAAGDWYSPPVVPLDTSEYWVHEDCGIWSAGVFLVKGKLYGLEEAVRLAKQTVCSTCHEMGATLGCFFKGCPNKYHYACAVQSDCVLNEDNFSMKCTKHKNKSVRASSVNRLDNR
ncbi:retinoic acid-induced protein 1 isoform X2 [Anguilla anguilla]|uniref:retinoic acid-induced protein 1 isoform X2 n=1 Tax=Anguilla anguilla TaxID=7936 RepID=UPI0015B0EE5E|nr:retinoic acid-induced protein 1 isoform X2 [Anguilla anguilla]